MSRPLLLASESAYKRALLGRLGLMFTVSAPHIDETAAPNESAHALSMRLAEAKTQAIRARDSEPLILGCDQAAEVQGMILEKPRSRQISRQQLQHMSGHEIQFYTSCCLDHPTAGIFRHTEIVRVKMRALSPDTIERYLTMEDALDCCGGFKIEGLGITLFEWVESKDPTALEGLPLIQISHWLRGFGFPIP